MPELAPVAPPEDPKVVEVAPDAPSSSGERPVAPSPADASAEAAPDSVAAPVTAGQRASRLIEGARFKAGRAAFDAAALKAGVARLRPASRPAAAAAALVLALGSGYGLARMSGGPDAALWGETTGEVRTANRQIARLASELDVVRGSLDALKAGRDTTRTDARQAQVLEKLERAGQDASARIARMAEQLDRIEKTQRDPARLAALGEKLDRIEKSVASSPPLPPAKPLAAAAAPVPDVKETGSIAEAKPVKSEPADPRKTPIEGFFVRDYDDGFALIETKAGRYIEVTVGYTVPGVGRVEAIERRGRQWVVQTTKGYIGER